MIEQKSGPCPNCYSTNAKWKCDSEEHFSSKLYGVQKVNRALAYEAYREWSEPSWECKDCLNEPGEYFHHSWQKGKSVDRD